MSEKGYIVVSEEPYGGVERKVFMTADAKEDAEHYAAEWTKATERRVDIIVLEIDVVQM